MEITRKIVFHAGHMLKDDTSKCFHPHGHEYVLECTISGAVKTDGAENGMVMNFGELKDIMMKEVHDRFDHKFLIENTDQRYSAFVEAVGLDAVYTTNWPPTAEELAEFAYTLIQSKMPTGIKVTKVKLQETYQCWVEYTGEKEKNRLHTVLHTV